MNLPDKNFKVKVGPFIYEVLYSEGLAEEGKYFGCSYDNEQKIILDPNKPEQKIKQTLVHELMHACNFVNGLTYRFDDKNNLPSEEDVIRELSMTFYQVMIDNPRIFSNEKVATTGKVKRPQLERSEKQRQRKSMV